MNKRNDPIQKRVGDFVEAECPGCTFIGISNDGEVYLSFVDEEKIIVAADKKRIKDHFGTDIGKLTTIVTVPISEVKILVDGLNQALKDTEEKKPQLLNIGKF